MSESALDNGTSDERATAEAPGRPRDPACVFCKIVAGELPATVVARNDHALAFRDLNPQAPTHVLVIPLDHYVDAAEVAGGAGDALAAMVLLAAEVADQEALTPIGDEGGYRIVLNTGAGAGQSVFHVHAHVLGGRRLAWPPG